MLFAKLKIRDSGAAVKSQDILSSLADNDPKIQHIDIYFDYGSNCEDDLETEEELDHLAVAIGKSTALKSIYVCHRMTSGSCVLGLLDQLSRNNRHLSHLHLNCKPDELDPIREEFIRLLGRFLEENKALVELEVRHFQIYPSQVKNLLEALTCRSCSLEILKLENCKMEQTSVKEMMKFLQDHPEMSPKNISMEQNYIGDDGCFFISQLLGNTNIELKGIELGENPIGILGFEHIANGLISRQHPLDKLSIGSNYFEECDRGMMAFLRAMATNPDLIPKNLIFEGSYEISSNVMRELGMLLTNRTSQIELLQLYCYSIGDVQLTAFVNVIRESPDKVPKTLDLTGINIGQRGYFDIAELLRSPNCSLKKLEMLDPHEYPDDDSIIRIVESLEENYILECLLVETGSISAHGWESLASLLCDWRSIHATFTSNHSIFEFGSPTEMQPLNIRLFLTMNKNPDKEAVARMKVIGFHFARCFNIDSFLEMQLPLLTELLHFLNISFVDLNEFFQQHDDLRHENDNNPKNNLLTVHYMIMKINLTIFDASRGRKL